MGVGEAACMGATRARKQGSRWRRIAVLLAVAALGAVVVRYRIGPAWLAYVGVDVPLPEGVELRGPASRSLASPRDDLPGLANFAWVSQDLCRGAQPTREGFRTLESMGVRTVVSLRESRSDRDELRGTSLRYVQIRMNPARPEDAEVGAYLALFGDEANLPIFVHCQKGADRTGTACAVYRIAFEGWPVEDAMKELPRFGFHEVWTGLLEYLRDADPERLRDLAASTPPPTVEAPPL